MKLFLIFLALVCVSIQASSQASSWERDSSPARGSVPYLTKQFLLFSTLQQVQTLQSSSEERVQALATKLTQVVFGELLAGRALLGNTTETEIRVRAWAAGSHANKKPALVFGPLFLKEALSDPTAMGGLLIREIHGLSRFLHPEENEKYNAEEDALWAESVFYREAVKNGPSRAPRVVASLEALTDFPDGPRWLEFVSLHTRKAFALQRQFAERFPSESAFSPMSLAAAYRDFVVKPLDGVLRDAQEVAVQWSKRREGEEEVWAKTPLWKLKLIKVDGLLKMAAHLESKMSPFIGEVNGEGVPSFRKMLAASSKRREELFALQNRFLADARLKAAFQREEGFALPEQPEAFARNSLLFQKWLQEAEAAGVEEAANFQSIHFVGN